MKLTLPNMISLLRLVLAPVFLLMFISKDPIMVRNSIVIYIIAALSDYFDGWTARKFNWSSNLGKFLDPLADKILTLSAFAAFVLMDIIPFWMFLFILIRDIYITSMRVYADNRSKPVITSMTAKFKTFLQMLFILFVLLAVFLYINPQLGYIISYEQIYDSSTIYYLMLILTSYTIWTGIEYSIVNWSLVRTVFPFRFRFSKIK